MSSSESLPKPRFYAGQVVCGRWKILREIGRGGCGVVVSVEHLTGDEETADSDQSGSPKSRPLSGPPSTRSARSNSSFRSSSLRRPLPLVCALKAETIDPDGRYAQTIRMEAHVLRRLQHSEHFCRLYLVCRMDTKTNVLIMSLVGRSLSWLRRQTPRQQFTLSTSVRASIQCLNAIQELHRQGFLHRDIKGSNFAIGYEPENTRIIHLLDFGFARSYLAERNGRLIMRSARVRAPFLGTERYCSVNVHERGEHGRVDDLWSFLYMLVEFAKGKLPWRDISHKRLARAKKFYSGYVLEKCPSELWRIMGHLETLKWNSRPDYELIRRALEDVCLKHGFTVTQPFDWEHGGSFYTQIRAADVRSRRDSLSSLPTTSTDITGSSAQTGSSK